MLNIPVLALPSRLGTAVEVAPARRQRTWLPHVFMDMFAERA